MSSPDWEEYGLMSYGLSISEITLPRRCQKDVDVGLVVSAVARYNTTIAS
jgi:hypothetical protein